VSYAVVVALVSVVFDDNRFNIHVVFYIYADSCPNLTRTA